MIFDTTPVPFTPPALIDDPGAPVYLIRPANRLGRANYQRDLAALGARYPADELLLAELRAGVAEGIAADQQGQWLAVLDEYELAIEGARLSGGDARAGLELKAGALRNLDTLARDMRRNHPPYAALEADRTHWLEVAPWVACRHFLAGWENVGHEFRLERGQVPEALLEAALADDHITAVGYRAMALMRPDRDAEKNSASRPGSPAGRATSTAARKRSTVRAGKSRARSTRKTPVS